ncbi:trafficking protein particle complex subunit 10 [Coniochaeta sp. 2T2.1]|nr:trafficking protein particle complex subunit 10 [Coniochaeta sp. 2T2.1]
MEQAFSTSKVTVEYFDPHGVFKLLAPGLIPRLPLHDLHWQSPSRPLRSIHTLHIDLVSSDSDAPNTLSPLTSPNPKDAGLHRSESTTSRDDGFQTASIGGRVTSTEQVDTASRPIPAAGKERRHQIPGLRRTPYLKLLLVRCDDNDTYKAQTRAEMKDWIKTHTTAPTSSSKKSSTASDNHDAFEWLIIHVVIPNTVAATQPRVAGSKVNSDSNPDLVSKSTSTSRWRTGSSTLLDKMRSDFNTSTKGTPDRVAQIRIGVNDVPYDMLPRVVPAVPTGYSETEQDAENAWADLISKFKTLILSSFDQRVSQYEEDIKEKDAQRSLPGWNFCTFFILKEGLARGFESVGLVEDALVGYDELSVGLDAIIEEQNMAGSAAAHGGVLLTYTEDLRRLVQKALSQISAGNMAFEDEEAVDLQPSDNLAGDLFKDIPISSSRKPYRDLILENKVSVFDFRCYIFARQISLLLRLGNAWSTREDLLAKLKEQQDSVMHLHGVRPRVPPPKPHDESENLAMLAEICRRTLEFIPAVSQIIRRDIFAGIAPLREEGKDFHLDSALSESIDNIIASFAFSVAQQILAQTSTKALPIPPSILSPTDGQEPKAAIPEPKTMMHPARSTSLNVRPGTRPPPSPNIFPTPGRGGAPSDADLGNNQFLKAGLEELAARRAELYALSRNTLEESGKRRGWSDGWASVPIVGDTDVVDMVDIDLSDDANSKLEVASPSNGSTSTSLAGIENDLLRTALDNRDDFYRLYEILTDKALRHYTVANYTHSVNTLFADLAVLKYYLKEYTAAASFYYRATPFYGESGWSLLELSMLVMYSKCLKELNKMDDYVTVLRKLLTKAAAAEMDRLQQQSSFRAASKKDFPNQSSIVGFLDDLLSASEKLQKDVDIPLANFFCDVELNGPPLYDEGQDSFRLTLRLRSLLAENLEAQQCKLKLVSPAVGGIKEIWLRNSEPIVLRPGKNKMELRSTTTIPGEYEVVHLALSANNVLMFHERAIGQAADKSLSILRNPRVALYQRSNALDVRLAASREVQLDKNNSLELELLTGWNDVTGCEVRIKAATGGLRLLMAEAKVVSAVQPVKKPEGGLFVFASIKAESSLKITFPFTVETDLLAVSVKVEVAYTTERGSFTFSKTPSVPIALALGVNVQDVFKHNVLFSKFAVSTASSSPLRLFNSELQNSDLFESHFGVAPSDPIVVFPKQPASLLYKITRKKDSNINAKPKKSMYLKLQYTVLLDEVEEAVEKSLTQALGGSEFHEYSKLVVTSALAQIREGLTEDELERCALLSEVRTSFLSAVKWSRYFAGLGRKGTQDTASTLAKFIHTWQAENPMLPLSTPDLTTTEPRSILIPVDIPSITIVHTADIRIDDSDATPIIVDPSSGASAVCINQLVPATLHLKWTRIWDTGNPDAASAPPPSSTKPAAGGPSPAFTEDLEFSYEVTAPSDTWLVGGRRKGHFVIPGASAGDDMAAISSSPDTEADIALLLVPLREGWLPFPSVEIREVKGAVGSVVASTAAPGGEEVQSPGYGACETDYRNLGETVRVIADRREVTLSLDASGPGGGPLVLETGRVGLGGRVVA